MIKLLFGILTCASVFFGSRYNLSLEILALRQQLGILHQKHPRPHLRARNRLFWILLRRLWLDWSSVPVIVKPETVVGWHRVAFVYFGVFVRTRKIPAGQKSMPRFGLLSDRWWRRMQPVNVTENPTGSWIVRQLRKAFPEPCSYCYAVLDRDAKFGKDVAELLVSSGIKPKRSSFRSPWQNGIAERWIGSCRQELLDHVIVLNEAHLRRLMRDYLSYYHEDRIHDSLEKDSPSTRTVSHKSDPSANLISLPRIGGLHHRYDWRQAA